MTGPASGAAPERRDAPERFVRRSPVPAPAGDVYRWHARPGALERLTPPWERVEVVSRSGGIEDGTVVLRLGRLGVRWVAEHGGAVPGREFRDTQVRGPFARWVHTHRFEPAGDGGSWLEDRIEYRLPLGRLGSRAMGASVRRRLDRTFAYRHRTTIDDLAAHASDGAGAPLRVLVTGASGLVGSVLVPFLSTGGHEVARLVRRDPDGAGRIGWDPARGRIDRDRLEGFDAVVHLAGESIAAGRWTAERRRRIRASRVDGTGLLAAALAGLRRPPRVLVSASAIGWYGDRGDRLVTEDSPPGEGFLADVCRAWEQAAEPARRAGIRVVSLRTGMVLTPAGGALARLLPPFRAGLGGPAGNGEQVVSWIAVDDLADVVLKAIRDDRLEGPVNAVAPRTVTNRELAGTLARVLRRPAVVPAPAAALRLALGELADELLLASTRVAPARLAATGHRFRFAELEPALRHLLGRVGPEADARP